MTQNQEGKGVFDNKNDVIVNLDSFHEPTQKGTGMGVRTGKAGSRPARLVKE